MKVTRDMFAEKVGELCKLIIELEEGQAEAAEYACVQIVTSGSDTYYEGLGIFQEAMLVWRQVCAEVMDEEDEAVEEAESVIIH